MGEQYTPIGEIQYAGACNDRDTVARLGSTISDERGSLTEMHAAAGVYLQFAEAHNLSSLTLHKKTGFEKHERRNLMELSHGLGIRRKSMANNNDIG